MCNIDIEFKIMDKEALLLQAGLQDYIAFSTHPCKN